MMIFRGDVNFPKGNLFCISARAPMKTWCMSGSRIQRDPMGLRNHETEMNNFKNDEEKTSNVLSRQGIRTSKNDVASKTHPFVKVTLDIENHVRVVRVAASVSIPEIPISKDVLVFLN